MAVITPEEAVSELARPAPPRARRRVSVGSVAAQVFMLIAAIVWITPVAFAIYVSLRPVDATNRLGYVSIAHRLPFLNFANAWSQSDM